MKYLFYTLSQWLFFSLTYLIRLNKSYYKTVTDVRYKTYCQPSDDWVTPKVFLIINI